MVTTWARGSRSEVREILLDSSDRRVPIDEKGKIEGNIRVSIFNGTTYRKIILERNDFSSNHDGMDECVGNLDPFTKNWILRVGVGGGGNEAGIEVAARISGIHTLTFHFATILPFSGSSPLPIRLFVLCSILVSILISLMYGSGFVTYVANSLLAPTGITLAIIASIFAIAR